MMRRPRDGKSVDGASPNVRAAVVGLGYWGPNLVRALHASPRADLVAVHDARPHRQEAIVAGYPEARPTNSYAEILEDGSIDAVVIATPVSTHFHLGAAALAAGKHVFIEKPLAHSVEAGTRLAEMAAERDLVLMPGHTFLYSPPVVLVKQLIDSGELGEVYFVSMSRVNLGLHQADTSVVWDLAPHDFSILTYWLDEVPAEVAAFARDCVLPGTPDVAFINLRFSSKTVAHVELAWLSPSKLRRTAIVGSEKMVVYDDTSNEPVRIFDSGAALPAPKSFGEYRLTYRTGDIVSPKIDAVEPLALELEDFCAAILDRTTPRSSVALGIDVLRAVEAVELSLAHGGAPVAPAEVASSDDRAGLLPLLLRRVRLDEQDRATANGDAPVEPAEEVFRGAETGVPLTAVLGAGPAGLTAAYVLGRRNAAAAVFEADTRYVGGIAKTVEVDGFRFDLGGHRFFTKLDPIRRFWQEILGADFLTRPRLSRIYYDGKYFSYPLKPTDVVRRLGIREATLCVLSYFGSSRGEIPEPETFEDWVTARFGRRLYDAFFRSYTEKIWGIPGSEIKSQWAAQRIRNFSLGKAITNLLRISRTPVTTLIEEFQYPRRGPGQLWESVRERVEEMGIPVHLGERCVSLAHDGRRVHAIVLEGEGGSRELPVKGVLSSVPLNELVLSLDPPPPAPVAAAARRLRYRDLCVVALMTTQVEPFPDNWIYLHDPSTRAGRVQNFGAWSPAMVLPGTACLGVEYFCFKGDEIWELSNEEAVELAKTELAAIGLIDPQQVFGGTRIRVPNAYPMYDTAYPTAVDILREYLARFENLQTFGRNGLHRYNNQDHSMLTAVLATVNLLEKASHDVWSVNTEAEYLEEGARTDEEGVISDAILEAELLGAPVHHRDAARTRALATRS